LHRCLQRHGISRLPDVEGGKPAIKKFKRYPIGYFHIDIAEVHTAEGKLYLFVAIDRTSKFAFARLVKKVGKMAAAQFLRDLIAAVPYRLHTVLTDNGIQFTNRKTDVHAFEHIFNRVCAEHGIEHRLYGPETFRSSPERDFFNSICHEQSFDREATHSLHNAPLRDIGPEDRHHHIAHDLFSSGRSETNRKEIKG